MGKLIFMPFSIGTGLVAGMIGKKLFERLWGLIDDEEPPGPEHRVVPVGKLLVALALEGAIFKILRGTADRGLRRTFLALTGSWPGEQRPEQA